MDSMTPAQKEAFAKAKGIKEEVTKEKAIATKTTPGMVVADEEYFKKYRGLGTEELTAEDMPTPYLSLIQNNSTLTDKEMRPLMRGAFYYAGDESVNKEVECSLLTFTKKDLPSFDDKSVMVRTYIFLGIIHPQNKIFALYVKRSGIGAAKAFFGELNKNKIPMFAAKVKLSSEMVKGDKGTYFKLIFNLNGIETDMEKLKKLESYTRRLSPEVKEEVAETISSDDIPF